MTGRPALAAQVLAILARDTARRDEDLAAELGVSPGELSPVIGQLYRQRRADRCAGYLVATATTQPVRPAHPPITLPEARMTPPTLPADDRTALLDAALACAARGWKVFPIRPRAKKPPAFPGHTAANCTGRDDPWCRTGHTGWEARATTDPGRIRRAWTQAPYNIGIATGPSGLLVIDLDTPKPGQHPPPGWRQPGITSGADVLAAICERHGQPWPGDTFTVRTGRGGLHLYFTAPPGARLGNTAGANGGGLGWLVDTRGHGGYVVAPGSTLPDGITGIYQVVNGQAPAVLPGWLVGLLTPTTAGPPSLGGRPVHPDQVADLDSYVATALKGEAERARTASAGGRNWALNKAAYKLGRLVAAGALPEDLAAAELYAAASVHFATDPPLTPAEARATITAGLTAGKQRPRPITPTATQQGAAA